MRVTSFVLGSLIVGPANAASCEAVSPVKALEHYEAAYRGEFAWIEQVERKTARSATSSRGNSRKVHLILKIPPGLVRISGSERMYATEGGGCYPRFHLNTPGEVWGQVSQTGEGRTNCFIEAKYRLPDTTIRQKALADFAALEQKSR